MAVGERRIKIVAIDLNLIIMLSFCLTKLIIFIKETPKRQHVRVAKRLAVGTLRKEKKILRMGICQAI